MTTTMQKLPDNTFWRVSVKALVFDAKQRLLVFMDTNREWEIPGGGWEHGEVLEACVARELMEEVGVTVTAVGKVEFCYQGITRHGYPKLSVAVRVTLDSMHFIPGSDDLVEARFVTREEFLKLPFQKGEATMKDYVNQIWQPVEN